MGFAVSESNVKNAHPYFLSERKNNFIVFDRIKRMATEKIKVKKTTNNNQFIKMVEIFEQNQDIARGFPTGGKSKQDVNNFWQELTITLNCLGPPVKGQLEWRKVWNDFKRNLKQKIAKIKAETKETGGGINTQPTLTPLEQQVDAIINLSLSGAPSGQMYPNKTIRSNTGNSEVQLEIIDDDYHDSNDENENILNSVDTPMNTPTINNRRRPSSTNTLTFNAEKERIKLLQQQTINQNEIVDLLKKIEKNSYNSQRYSKKRLEIKVKQYELMKREFERQQKNDLFENKLALEQIKIKKRKLKLEEKKLGCANVEYSSSDN